MKQRDKRGRYERVYRKASRFEVVVLYSVLGGILFGIVFDLVSQPHVFEVAQAAEEVVIVEPVPQEVLIEVKYDWTTDRIEQELRVTFPLDGDMAVAVAKSESGAKLNPNAYNPEWHYDAKGNKVCQGSYGVMQIACVHHIENPKALFDVKFNLEKAKQIHAESVWRQWGGYSSGGYKKYMLY